MFAGVYTALVTPFHEDGSIDEAALRALVDSQIEAGIHGIVPMGTTGESPTVTHDENIRVIEIVAEQAAGRTAIIAGTGSNSTAEAVRTVQKSYGLPITGEADALTQIILYNAVARFERPTLSGARSKPSGTAGS